MEEEQEEEAGSSESEDEDSDSDEETSSDSDDSDSSDEVKICNHPSHACRLCQTPDEASGTLINMSLHSLLAKGMALCPFTRDAQKGWGVF